jgi:hypothetical protein
VLFPHRHEMESRDFALMQEWDLICEADHGCEAIPVPRAMFGDMQRNDPRCGTPASVSAEDAEFVRQWQELVRNAEAAAGR